MSREVSTHARHRWPLGRVGSGLLILLVVIGLVAGWWLLGGSGAFAPRTVEELLAAEQDMHPVEATAELCRDPVCVEGWRTDYGRFVRFESEGEAEHWVTVLGDDGRRWKTVVLDMRDTDLTFEQRRHAIDTLFAAHDW